MPATKILQAIKNKVPELDIEQNDGAWTWTFRCVESADRSDGYFDSYEEALADFIACQVELMDKLFQWKP